MPGRPIVLDTNFLLIPFRFKINILAEIDYLVDRSHFYVVSSQTIEELKSIGRKRSKDGIAARLALKMIKANSKTIEVIESNQFVDDWVVDYSKENHAIAATNDSGLRARLKKLKIKTITLKSKTTLGFV
ncbi:hypothetical protein HY988_05230 [Candidatus Micrarchaeota archaeon]|nr:hypothetical protein [Candidatus Micrarchaeota archaeon]